MCPDSESRKSPATDARATYDYQSTAVDRPALVQDIDGLIDGEVRGDSYSRQLYATDASIYEVTPIAVVFPTSRADVSNVVSYCHHRDIPVLPRGGGTSLAGQTVNEAVVLDFTREMNDILTIDPGSRTVTAQPGIYLGRLNEELAAHDLKFAPDPAWGDKSALGGAIGNNSTGAHSLAYGKTDAYVESVEVVLADGTITTFGEVDREKLRELAEGTDLEAQIYAEIDRILEEDADRIEEIYPDLKRNVSGYNLDCLVDRALEDKGRIEGDPIAERRSVGENVDGGEDGWQWGSKEAGDSQAVDEQTESADIESDDVTDTDDPTTTKESDPINVAKLLCGSEGTLAIVTEATVSLEPIPETKSMALLAYDTILDAMEDVPKIVEHGPAAVEVLDDVLLDLARTNAEFGPVTKMVPEESGAVLIVEFYAADTPAGKQKVRTLLADRCPSFESNNVDDSRRSSPSSEGQKDAEQSKSSGSSEGASSHDDGDSLAFDAIEAYDAESRAKIWKLRKSGLPILLSRTTDEKHVAFIEDTAVPPEHLRDYVAEFQRVLEDHDTYASFYAHAGPGVLHIRPLVNTKTVEGLETMESIADAATDLVVEYGGSISGEHGDGRARTQWNRKLYEEDLWETFQSLKSAFDPKWLLNPGQVVFRDDNPTMMTAHQRLGPAYEFDAGFDPVLSWENDQGLQGMVELCHGCGGCRGDQSTTGGVMCPTFRASREEITSTRGRANALRHAMSGDLDLDAGFSDEFVEEVLDLCIGCKGCAIDCPSEVDMAKLKAEVTHEYHNRNGASLRDHLFARIHRLSALGSKTAPLSNLGPKIPGARRLLERTMGIARERPLPTFHSETFRDWFDDRGGPTVDANVATRRVILYPDTITNYCEPAIGRAAVRVLEATDVHVAVPDQLGDTGRPAFSKGFLHRARAIANENVSHLHEAITDGWDVVVLEPSDAVMIQSDYLDLLPGEKTESVAAHTAGICEYLDETGLAADIFTNTRATPPNADSLTYHGHCHQKATAKDHHAVSVLRRAGYTVDPIDSGCCGMAGSFGYEAEHSSMSSAIASLLYEQVDESTGDRVVAPGASCRTQLTARTDGTSHDPQTPIEYLESALE